MKNLFFLLTILLTLSLTTNAQNRKSKLLERQVSKSLYGIQVGLSGIFVHNEFRLGPEASVKIEAGLNFAAAKDLVAEDRILYIFPTFNIEPRYYYNLGRRLKKEKFTHKNSGNFVSLLFKARTGRTIRVQDENRRYKEDFGVFAKWGLKRTFGKHFTLETAVGPGIVRSNSYSQDRLRGSIDVSFRFGYTF